MTDFSVAKLRRGNFIFFGLNASREIHLVLRLLQICAQNQGNSISEDLKCKHVLIIIIIIIINKHIYAG